MAAPHGSNCEAVKFGSFSLRNNTTRERFKELIKPMDKASEVLLALRPVTFRYKPEIDPERVPQFGLVAEEVANVNPDLVVRDKNGEIFSVRYDQVNAMLLNEFLKEHRTVQEQKATIAQLKTTVENQEATNARSRNKLKCSLRAYRK